MYRNIKKYIFLAKGNTKCYLKMYLKQFIYILRQDRATSHTWYRSDHSMH